MESFTIGKILRSDFRKHLDYLKFSGQLEDYLETKSFWDSQFLLKGISARGASYLKALITYYNSDD